MKTQHKLLTVKEVVQILVDKEVISEKVAEYELHYQENMETYENEYWLTKLEN
ncbi:MULTISPECIES: hypothetical protein [Enterococcus]|uniref:hypothetical protein n=1 Tax=Enterococcus TaxID=1350 RepID=UPI00143281A2|nr:MULTISPECIES: hypothetical protein [Enterococcus]EME8256528.1 hypothetical protein [Enterococcus faecium]NRE78488.1 hypothetical protein [Enterococcus faecium]